MWVIRVVTPVQLCSVWSNCDIPVALIPVKPRHIRLIRPGCGQPHRCDSIFRTGASNHALRIERLCYALV